MSLRAMTFRKIFVVVAALAAMGVAAGAAFAQATDAHKRQVDQAKAQGIVGEQAQDGLLDCRTTCAGDLRQSMQAINDGRTAEYQRIGQPDQLSAQVVGARNFERFIFQRIPAGQWYRNASGQWVQR